MIFMMVLGCGIVAPFEFPGGVAQLGERLHGMQEVVGSIPSTSIFHTQKSNLDLGGQWVRLCVT